MDKKELKPKGKVIFYNNLEPVTWERETHRYVYNVTRMKEKDTKWIKNRKLFEEKMDKTEIFDGSFKEEYIPKSEKENILTDERESDVV